MSTTMQSPPRSGTDWSPALATLLLLTGSCITPQIVLESDKGAIDLREFPAGTELVELAVGDDAKLRGVFVPADPEAPVVVHFLESGCSITQGSISFPSLEAVWQLRDLGFASLSVDYQGVGTSSGKRSSENIRADASTVFAEARRRAGGAENRVLLRGLSIGALASASLLEEGREPAAVVLVAPVRSETVAVHHVGRTMAEPLDEILGFFMKAATDINLMDALQGKTIPMLIVLGERDELLPEVERRFLRYAVRSTRGRLHERPGEDHIDTVLEAHKLFPEEFEFYRELFPLLPPVSSRVERVLAGLDAEERGLLEANPEWRQRLTLLESRWFVDSPVLAAALALTPPESPARDRQRVDWLRRLPIEDVRGLPLQALVALVDMTDDSGPLDPDELPAMERLVAEWRAVDGDVLTAEEIVAHAHALRLEDEARLPASGTRRYVELYEGERLVRRAASPESQASVPPRLKLPPEAAIRQAVLLLLKAAGMPARPCEVEALEVWSGAVWQKLRLSREWPETCRKPHRLERESPPSTISIMATVERRRRGAALGAHECNLHALRNEHSLSFHQQREET